MATLAIGDVHGEYRKLTRLLAAARPAASDQIVLVGDLVGRGPSGHDVLHWAADQGERVATVLGNHDLHLLWAYYLERPCRDEAKRELLAAPDARQLFDWLRRHPLVLPLEHCGALIVHAGVWHEWDLAAAAAAAGEFSAAISAASPKAALAAMHGSAQRAWSAKLAAPERMQAAANICTRMRVCAADGSVDLGFGGRPGEPHRAGSTAWFDYPGRRLRGTLIVCGHWSALGLFMRADIAMLDAGCCFGGPLVGLWVEERRLVAVNS